MLARHKIPRAKELWEAKIHLDKMKEYGGNISVYAKKHNFDYRKLCKLNYLINYKRYTQPEWYSEYVNYANEYKSSNLSKQDFLKKYNIKKAHLGETKAHLSALKLIKEYENYIQENNQENTGKKIPSFISVPQSVSRRINSDNPEPKFTAKKNDIELIITKGVKVIVSPDFPSDKFIKIIELLKDL